MPLTFTRYLYVKDEVKYALLMALLSKEEDIALFWAHELYYSGFTKELFEYLWIIYYDFYASLNPAFEKYLTNKHKDFLKEPTNEIIANIIINLCLRPFNTDVFMLRQIVKQFQIEVEKVDDNEDLKMRIADWLAEHNYECLAQYILEICKENQLQTVMEEACSYFVWSDLSINTTKEISSWKKNKFIDKRHLTLTRIMMFYSLQASIIKPKNIYLTSESSELEIFKTIINTGISPRKVLEKACVYNINSSNNLSLFKLERNDTDIRKMYRRDWLYYASLSPYWLEVIKQYEGTQDNEAHKILFADSQKEEDFYDTYYLDSDEQKLEVQNKSTQDIVSGETNVRKFYETTKKFNIVAVCDEYLDNFDSLIF
jgi:hypothetical protein